MNHSHAHSVDMVEAFHWCRIRGHRAGRPPKLGHHFICLFAVMESSAVFLNNVGQLAQDHLPAPLLFRKSLLELKDHHKKSKGVGWGGGGGGGGGGQGDHLIIWP